LAFDVRAIPYQLLPVWQTEVVLIALRLCPILRMLEELQVNAAYLFHPQLLAHKRVQYVEEPSLVYFLKVLDKG
jgi:hypothetical protein